LWRRFANSATREPAERLLSKLAMAAQDDAGIWRPTVAGLLLASRDPQRHIPGAFIQAVAYAGVGVTPQTAAAYQRDALDHRRNPVGSANLGEYADLVWCETGTPDLECARQFADAVHARHPGKLLAYNCSPSFNWEKNLDDATIAKFQRELGAMGYKYQCITLAGIHSMWYNMFDLAQDYAARGMSADLEKVQEPEFAARERGYTFVSHQQEIGTGYFDDVTTVIQGGASSVTAPTGSTEEEQFH
jgi:isocitrate lyase